MDANPGLCDIETGICTTGAAATAVPVDTSRLTATRITYVTDPVCSACWVMEPAWRSLTARYGDMLDVVLVYGGLLPRWEGFADPGAGIRGPGDVARHWDQYAHASGQPIDSSVWRTDPLGSSHPACVAAAAVRLVAPELEEVFLRRLRESLFLHARNIARREVQREAAVAVGVDPDAFTTALDDGRAHREFEADLRLLPGLGVRGFPTVVVEGPAGRLVLHGARRLEDAVLTVGELSARPHLDDVATAVGRLGTGTTAEYAAVLGLSRQETRRRLSAAGLRRCTAGAGEFWTP